MQVENIAAIKDYGICRFPLWIGLYIVPQKDDMTWLCPTMWTSCKIWPKMANVLDSGNYSLNLLETDGYRSQEPSWSLKGEFVSRKPASCHGL